MVRRTPDEDRVWDALAGVKDPEIPVLSIVEMKIVSLVRASGSSAEVEITPTFAGCPAIGHMKDEIRKVLTEMGFTDVRVETNFSAPWSTDLLEPGTREKLRSFGIAPPPATVQIDLGRALAEPVPCPYCASAVTHLESAFGATLCKQIFYCDSCRQSFERFKPL